MRIKEIKINSLIHPLGLDASDPVITWEIEAEAADQKNIQQQSYRVTIFEEDAGSAAMVWDSGIVESRAQRRHLTDIELKPCTRYQAQVHVQMSGENVLTGKTVWETGFLNQKKWEGEWIGTDRPIRQNVNIMDVFAMHDPEAETSKKPVDSIQDLYPVVYFERMVTVKQKKVIKARIYATAHGVYEIEMNGRRVGDMELAPEFSSYQAYLQYQTYDVTEQVLDAAVQDKQIRLKVLLSDGYFIGRIGVIGLGYEYGDHTDLLFQMEITYADGEVQKVVSDTDWKYGDTNILYSDIFIGEKQDMRANWEPAEKKPVVFNEDRQILAGQEAEPLQILERIPAERILRTPAGETVIDFGQVLNGRASVTLNGAEGEVVILSHTEVLDKEGNFFRNIPEFNCEMQDIFILKAGQQTICPRFTIHGFRYVRIQGFHGELKAKDCEALVIGSNCRKTGAFHTSDVRLNQLQHNIEWSQKSNFFSIPMDCPQRERAGWTGDIQIYGPTAVFNMDASAFLRRWLRQVRLEQRPNGVVPSVVPYSQGYQNMSKQFGSDTSAGWGDVCVILPWTLYMAYGDLSFLEENFAMMEKWMSYIKAETQDIPESAENLPQGKKELYKYLWTKGFHYGDWLYPSTKNEEGVSDAFYSAAMTREKVAPAMYAYSVQTMIKVCDALQYTERKAYYEELDRNIRQAYSEIFVEKDGRILPELQGIYVLALRMNLISPELKQKAVGHLARLIRENGYCLDTGFLSVPFLLDVLYENGERELAYRLLFNEKCPSWLYEVKQGATTIWESWDAITEDGVPHESSLNHYAFGCVGDFMYRTILGIRPQVPGYQSFIVEPDVFCGLDEVSGSLDTPYGRIAVAWKKAEKQIHLSVQVPMNTQAKIICKNTHSEHLVGSGQYEFLLQI